MTHRATTPSLATSHFLTTNPCAFATQPPKLSRPIAVRYAPIELAVQAARATVGPWLGAEEQRELAQLRDRGRREQWLAGRWLAKQVIHETTGVVSAAHVQILTRDEHHRGDRPRVLIGSQLLDRCLSIAHSARGVLVALATTVDVSIGVDLASNVPTNDGFCRLWFSDTERRWLAGDRTRRANILWAVKEAVYKSVQQGEIWHPRDVEVLRRDKSGFACRYRRRPLDRLEVEIRDIDRQVAAFACVPRALDASRPSGAALPPREISRPAANTPGDICIAATAMISPATLETIYP